MEGRRILFRDSGFPPAEDGNFLHGVWQTYDTDKYAALCNMAAALARWHAEPPGLRPLKSSFSLILRMWINGL